MSNPSSYAPLVRAGLFALAVLSTTLCLASELNITTFGAHPDTPSDTTPAVAKALAQCRQPGPHTLLFPKGRYDFWPDFADERYYFISNNDEGLKRIAFPLRQITDLTIDGQGSQFIFHGYLNPFILDSARNITLKNLSIDFARTFHSEAKILAEHPDGLDVEFSESFPYRIDNNLLVFTSSDDKPPQETTTSSREITYPFGSLLEFDPVKRETAFMAPDYWCGNGLPVESLGGRKIRLLKKGLKGTPGNVMVFGARDRKIPAITISDTASTLLDNVTIYHCGGMGVIAQRSRDINLQHLQVTPAPNSGRIVSITADATHFVNCSGKIEMAYCLFENQKDDPSNLHGIYARVSARTDDKIIVVQLVHPQQFGFDFITPGMNLELVHGPSMITFGDAKVLSVERLNKEFTRVTFESPLPADLKPGDAVAQLGDYASVHIHHCTMRGNRARGILLNSRGKTLIENNFFHVPGAALLFEGDARYWFEQGGVRDCVIRNNTFDNCNYGVWDRATIEVAAGIEESARPASRYNRNILIEGNTFRVFDPRIITAYSIDGLIFRNNRFEKTTAYPTLHPDAVPFDIQHSDHVQLDPPAILSPPIPPRNGDKSSSSPPSTFKPASP